MVQEWEEVDLVAVVAEEVDEVVLLLVVVVEEEEEVASLQAVKTEGWVEEVDLKGDLKITQHMQYQRRNVVLLLGKVNA